MDVKGGCSPQNNLGKLRLLVIELAGRRNKILHDLCDTEQSLQRSCRSSVLAASAAKR